MRICFVHEEYPEETNFGGIATYQKNMAEELVKQGNQVFVICRSLKENKKYVENGVNITRIFVEQTKNQIWNYEEYRRLVAKELKILQDNDKIDIIEVPDWGAETIFFEKYRKIPIVVRLHTPLKVWLKYNKNNFGKITKKMLKWENYMIKHADLVTCCSQVLKEIIVKDFKMSPNDIFVIPNPANIKNFYYDKNIKKNDELLFIGSLEERKGVIVLAKALNEVFREYPNLKIKFIGKDTTRNSKNISTIEYIKELVDTKYQDNLIFVGQIPNYDLNLYLNQAKVGIFPSLFDNFPYVILESMITGIHIIGSKNSGMVEMLNDDTSIYNTGDYLDLAKRIIEKYKLSNKSKINKNNIKRVKDIYNSKSVVTNIINFYKKAINNYKPFVIKEMSNVLSKAKIDDNIKSISKIDKGVANTVYKVVTQKDEYVVKKYNYNYNFKLSDRLYSIYKKNNIKVCKPINNKPIEIKGNIYNVFEYIKCNRIIKTNIDYANIIGLNKKTTLKSTLKEKCNNYYNYLLLNNDKEKLLYNDISYVLGIFSTIKDMKILDEKSINHGDISKSNIIFNKKDYYIIDFDETCVTTPLYDFAVIVVKNFIDNGCINIKKYSKLRKEVLQKLDCYDNTDFSNIVKYYLCKILLEKFYLYYTNKIDLYSFEQQKDNYKTYLEILKKFNSNIC